MSSLNRATILGHLGRDPEIRTMQNGGKVANLSIAATEKWRDKQTGEQRERTEWLRCVAFGPLAEICERHLRKGSRVYVEGRIQTRKWTDQAGQERYATEIVMQGFDGKLVMLGEPSGSKPASQDSGGYGGYDEGGGGEAGSSSAALDDEIPF